MLKYPQFGFLGMNLKWLEIGIGNGKAK